MPWNDASKPGPWGGPPKAPSPETKPSETKPQESKGQRPAGKAPRTPKEPPKPMDLSALTRRPALAALVGVGFAASYWAFSTGAYHVPAGQSAALYRFGVLERIVGPGSGYNLPAPFGAAVILPLDQAQTIEGGAPGEGGPATTADGQLADLRYVASWKISNPVAYLSAVQDPGAAVKIAVAAGINAAAAGVDLQSLRGPAKAAVQTEAARRAQGLLDALGAGVRIEKVEIATADLPQPVREDPQAVPPDEAAELKALDADAAGALAKARDQAVQAEKAAVAEREPELKRARDEANAFDRVLADAQAAPEGARERLYAQAMSRVLARSNRIVIDAPNATVVLPPQVTARAGSPPRPAMKPTSKPAPKPTGGAGL